MFIICIILLVYVIITFKNKITYIIIIILLFIINLRIMIPSNNMEIQNSNLDILFVIDNTISMNALDYNGKNTRLSGVKKDCNYIIDYFPGARYSIITFNNTSKVVTPFTYDSNINKEAIDILEPIDELYAKGSSLNTPIDYISKMLNNSKNDHAKIIFFISDGEITDDSRLDSYRSIRKYISNGAVLGYGTSSGGKMKSNNRYDQTDSYIMDYSSYGDAISRIDEDNLKSIANDLNIDYINMNDNNIDNKLNSIKKYSKSSFKSLDKSNYDDIYYLFVIPILILLLYDFCNIRRDNR